MLQIHMNKRPTPETDAFFRTFVHGQAAPSHAEYYDRMRRLERERDEAREAAEKAKSYKRVLKQDNAKLRRELDKSKNDADAFIEKWGKSQERAINAERKLDELNKRLIEVSQFGVVAAIEREDVRTKLDDSLAFNMRASRDASLYASMLHEKLEDERALADRLASVMFGCTARDMNDAYDAWKETRK